MKMKKRHQELSAGRQSKRETTNKKVGSTKIKKLKTVFSSPFFLKTES
jgi:hypothetical protein